MGELGDALRRVDEHTMRGVQDIAPRDAEKSRRSTRVVAEFIEAMQGRPQIPYYETSVALNRRPAVLLRMGWIATLYHSGAADRAGTFVVPDTSEVYYCSHPLRSTGMQPEIELGTIYVTNCADDFGRGSELVKYPFGTDEEVRELASDMRALSRWGLENIASADGYPRAHPYRF